MLRLTTQAAEMIKALRDSQGGGNELLRVSSRDGSSPNDVHLAMEFVPAAGDGDQIIESEGVVMCVAENVADALQDKVVDAAERPQGKVLVLRAA